MTYYSAYEGLEGDPSALETTDRSTPQCFVMSLCDAQEFDIVHKGELVTP